MIVGVSANLLSRRAASPDLGRRAIGVWAFAASLSKDLQQETKASTSSARTGVGSPDYGVLLYTPRPLNQSETPRCRLPSRGR